MKRIPATLITLCLMSLHPCMGESAKPDSPTSSPTPADPNASATVRTVLEYITNLPNRDEKKLMTGQFLGWYPNLSMEAAEEIHEQSGEWVAMIGLDYYETKLTDAKLTEPEFWKPPRWRENNALIKEYWAKGGLTTLSVHITNPFTGGKSWDRTRRPREEILKLFDPETEVGKAYLEQLNGIADGIEDLQKEGIVVLYRPLHEWYGFWFWWGELEPDLAKKLWRHMFNHFTEARSLHNIIWVYNGSMERYPGDDYVDLNSRDYYKQFEENFPKHYREMKPTGKPFALGEFGPPGNTLDPDTPRNYDYSTFAKRVIEMAPDTVYFLAWRDAWGLHRNLGAKELMNDPLVVNRDDLAGELFPKIRESTP